MKNLLFPCINLAEILYYVLHSGIQIQECPPRLIGGCSEDTKKLWYFVHLFLEAFLWYSGKIRQLNLDNRFNFVFPWQKYSIPMISIFLKWFVLGKERNIPKQTKKKAVTLNWANLYSLQPTKSLKYYLTLVWNQEHPRPLWGCSWDTEKIDH